ncbi:MAG TPA: hypothetical protein VNN73_14350 [Blastocatellia bacterium]|nr:hypothetical protein [Blastocatellia bacterium]
MKRCAIQSGGKRAALFAFSLALVFLLAASLLVVRPVGAQDASRSDAGAVHSEDFEMIVKAGFVRLEVNGREGNWVPFRITLSNQGQPINGRLVVHCENPTGPTPIVREYISPVNLPTGSVKSIEIAAFLNSWQNPIVRLIADDGRVVAETALSIVGSSSSRANPLDILVVDNDPTALNNINATQISRAPNREPFKSMSASAPAKENDGSTAASPQAPGAQGRARMQGGLQLSQQSFEAHPTVISPAELPRDFVSFDTIDALVIGEAPLNQLTREQSRAIKLWVASGGLLIVTGGADFAGMSATGLQDILPVEAQSAATASQSSLPELTAVYGQFDSNDALTMMIAQTRANARVLIGASAKPVIAERIFGSGIVRFVAINPKLNPYRGWIAAKDLWNDLLLPAAEARTRSYGASMTGRRGGPQISRGAIQNSLYDLAQIKPPSPKYFLLFLLFYVLAVGPVNYFVLRWKRKTDLAWLTIPAVVILFTAVSVTVAEVSRGSESIIADISLVELNQRERIARSAGDLLMVPASKGMQEVVFSGGSTYANDSPDGNFSGSASASGPIEAERGQSGFTLRVPMTTWTSAHFQFRSVDDNAQPIVEAFESPGAVTIKNLSDNQLSKAVYLSPSGISSVFDLEPRAEQKIYLSAPPSNSFNRWYATQLGASTEEANIFIVLSYALDRQIGGEPAFAQSAAGGFFETQMMTDALKRLEHPLLICFSESQPTAIEFEESFKRQSRALYMIHL